VYWWNSAGEILAAAGLLIEALSFVASAALIVSRFAGRRSWPYVVAALLVCCVLVWVGPSGFVRDLDAHFEWNTADGFSAFHLQDWDAATGTWRAVENSTLSWLIQLQLQPQLRGYFKLNDWPKMNGDISLKVARIIPIAWPVALGSGAETLEDPDETALMRAAVGGDVKTLKELLHGANSASVNALDQGGQSALILACQNPKTSPDVVKALIAAGANVNLRSRNGYTALTWALARNNKDVSQILRRAGGRP
jgi:hypothetical protein